jgi:hypothetical protein
VAADDVLSALTASWRTMKAAKRSSPASIAPGSARVQVATSPVKPPASAEVSRYELADGAAECVRGLDDALPGTDAGEVPAFPSRFCSRVAGEEAFEAKGADARKDIEAAVVWAARQLELDHEISFGEVLSRRRCTACVPPIT